MPAAHSPPIPRPKSARSANSIAYEVENPLRHAKSENHSTDSISGSLRPHLSAIGAGDRAAHEPHHQRDRAERAGQRAIHGEALLDVDEDEGEDVEVERVDDPPEEHRPERAPLILGDLPVPGAGILGRVGSGGGTRVGERGHKAAILIRNL